MSDILTSSACMLAWVMAGQNSFSICMHRLVMASLRSLDWVVMRLSLFGHRMVAFCLLGHGFMRVSLSGLRLGQDHLSQGPDWGGTIPLSGRTISSLNRTILAWMCSHWIPDISQCALTLKARSRSLHVTWDIFLPHPSLSSIELVRFHRIIQIGNIDVTFPCVDGF